MLDRERGEMGVGDKIPVHAGQREQFAEDVRMALARLRYPDCLAGKPRRHFSPSSGNRQ